MTAWQQFAVALFAVSFPLAALYVLAKVSLLAGKQQRLTIERLLTTVDDLTAEVIAFKNPWAAEQFARFKSMANQAPRPDTDDTLDDELARRDMGVDEQELM